mmetsp:Transcript_6020/g.18706  ORF Transcript_6020/g.18706 Transcript_6020/m.18706 type:complete len:528 (+) Transcript_6020:58-1641(+)
MEAAAAAPSSPWGGSGAAALRPARALESDGPRRCEAPGSPLGRRALPQFPSWQQPCPTPGPSPATGSSSRWRCEVVGARSDDGDSAATPSPVAQRAPRAHVSVLPWGKQPGLGGELSAAATVVWPPPLRRGASPDAAGQGHEAGSPGRGSPDVAAANLAGRGSDGEVPAPEDDSDADLLAACRMCEDRARERLQAESTERCAPPEGGAVPPGSPKSSEGDAEAEITLRLRLGTVVVKREPQEDIGGAVCSSAPPPAPDLRPDSLGDSACEAHEIDLNGEAGDSTATVTLRCRLGISRVKQEEPDVLQPEGSTAAEPPGQPAADASGPVGRPVTDLRQLFQQQQQQQRGQQQGQPSAAGGQEQLPDQEQQQQQQAEQFEAAQIASYETNVSERQGREARERELVQQGDTGPLEMLDEELMSSLYAGDGMLCWLESAENRGLLFRYLELRSRATRWYREPAEAYFRSKRRHLNDMLEQPDAAILLTPFLREETEKVEAEMFSMPEKGRFVPQLFAPLACTASSGCLELD